jgi:hypothetical protein
MTESAPFGGSVKVVSSDISFTARPITTWLRRIARVLDPPKVLT